MEEIPVMIFRSFLIKLNYSENSIKNYCSAVSVFLKWHNNNLSSLSSELLYNYVEYLKQTHKSFSCIKNSIISLKLFAKIVLELNIYYKFIKTIQKKKKLPETLTLEEIVMLIDSFDNLKHKTIIALIYSCGLKVSECLKIMLKDIDFINKTIKIKKGKTIRFIPLSDRCCKMIKEYCKQFRPRTYLFNGQDDEEYSARSIQQILKNGLIKCNIKKKISVNSLRHSFATHLVKQGVDIHIIKDILGHKDIRTTQIYNQIASVNIAFVQNPFDRI